MLHMSGRNGFSSFSASRRRTVSRDRPSCSVSLTIAPASNSRVQRARPAGGLEQAVATSSASSLPESFRSAPGRDSSLRAASRLPRTKRRLVRYTVEPPTATLIAISSSLAPASAASRICARFSLRAACLPPLSSAVSAVRSAWLRSTRYRTFIVAPQRLRAQQMNQMPGVCLSPSQPCFTQKQGQYLAFIHAYTLVLGRPPAEADLQRHFRVTPPSAHQMVLTLERAGLIRRQPGVARSIQVLVDPEALPALQASLNQTVKSSVQRY